MLLWLSWAVRALVSFTWFRDLVTLRCERYWLQFLHRLGWELLGVQRSSQSLLRTVRPYICPSTSITSTSESTYAALLPDARLLTTSTNSGCGFPGHRWALSTHCIMCCKHVTSETRDRNSFSTLLVDTNFPATWTCQDISVLTVIDLSTLACDIGDTFIMQSWIEVAECTGVHAADGGAEESCCHISS